MGWRKTSRATETLHFALGVLGQTLRELPPGFLIDFKRTAAQIGIVPQCNFKDTHPMTTSSQWIGAIRDACLEPDPVRSNQLITCLHYRLSEELAARLGRDAGPNFHSWAVWGSRKAGVTIRQEDLDSAITNATRTAGVVGSAVGACLGGLIGRVMRWDTETLPALAGDPGS